MFGMREICTKLSTANKVKMHTKSNKLTNLRCSRWLKRIKKRHFGIHIKKYSIKANYDWELWLLYLKCLILLFNQAIIWWLFRWDNQLLFGQMYNTWNNSVWFLYHIKNHLIQFPCSSSSWFSQIWSSYFLFLR